MTKYDKPGPLDGAIDDAVREMMQVDPRPDLRRRVTGAIGARPRRVDGVRLGLVWAASLAAVAVASVMLFRSPEPAQPVLAPQAAEASRAMSAPPTAEPAAAAAPRTARTRAPRPRDPAPESIFGPRADRVAAASVPVGTPETSPAAADDAVTLDSAPVPGGLPRIAPIGLIPIQVAPIAIEPLSVSAIRR